MSHTAPDLIPEHCRARQQRLLEAVRADGVDWIVLTRRESVQWLTGVRVGDLFTSAAAMSTDGRVVLALPERNIDMPAAADDRVGFEAKWHSTIRNDQPQACSAALAAAVGRPPRRIGCEFSALDEHLRAAWKAELVDIEPTLFALRRKKHPDELAMLRHANEANRVMYELAREIVRPGVNELEVYCQLHDAAVHMLGEPLTYFGQDFRSADRGGPPRDRLAQAGELYILDLGVGYRGYFSDNARTIAVGGSPTAAQQRAWAAVCEVFALVEQRVRPGVSCKQLFAEVQELLDRQAPWEFNHHLGHGVGLAPHEGPHLNPHWDDHFAEGDFFTAEPGLYHADLNAGLRLEQNYLVTADGVELLTDWPLEL